MSNSTVDNDFVKSDKQPLSNTVSPTVINAEKKMKLENSDGSKHSDQSEGDMAIETSPEPVDSAKTKSSASKATGTDLTENSLNSSAMWTSTENSFVQVNDKLLHRGIQTEREAYVNNNGNNNNNNFNKNNNINSNMLSMSYPNNLNSSGRQNDAILQNSLPNFQKVTNP